MLVAIFLYYQLKIEELPMASKREKIKLKSSKSPFHYYTTKNKISTPDRITLKKFDPVVKQHVEFKETK